MCTLFIRPPISIHPSTYIGKLHLRLCPVQLKWNLLIPNAGSHYPFNVFSDLCGVDPYDHPNN